MLISVVSPVYKGEKMLTNLVNRIEAAVETFTDDYEIVLVNDCSPDDSWTKICEICAQDKRVKAVNLSRNFGQQYAITAGLSVTKGQKIVVIDCDLQNRPEEIPHLYQKALEGYDTVFSQRIGKPDSYMKRLSSKIFNKVFSFLSDTHQDDSVAEFGLYDRKVIDAVLSMGDSILYFPIQVQWVGFRIGYLPAKMDEREEGTSGYDLYKLMKLATDTMIGFSDKPLKLMLRFGLFIIILSLVLIMYYLYRYVFGHETISGFTTLVMSIWLIGGIVISLLGITGLYIGKIFDRVKGRPTYIIKETLNINE
ncbi:MAG: glycosyltransferase family 2 protein [Bacteroidaceae bacterium]|nr:glycosyltransferase family 2 protein [Bacteroidaceae bacterium]